MDLREARARVEIVRHPWELARFEVVNDILLKHFNNQDKLVMLDVGCGDTFFVENLAQRFPNSSFYGIDIEFKEADLAYFSEQFKDKSIQVFDALEQMEIDFPHQEVDALLLLDVIEHIEDDVAFLKMLSQKPYITAKTKFFITVPAFQSLYTTHDDFLGHYRRYNNTTLLDSLNKSNHVAIERGYFFFSLLPVRLLKMIKERILGKEKESTGLVEWSGNERSTNFIKQVLRLDYSIAKFLKNLGVKLPGLSNFSVSSPRK